MSAASGPATARRARPAAMRNGRASGQAARELLLDVAEELFGFRGVSAVSTREIAVAAGQGNNSAVQYHFGGKQGLIRALIESRNDVVELGRRQLLAASPDPAEATAAELFRILWQPLLELPTRKGHHCFIRFMLAWQIQLGGADHPFVEQPQRYPAWHALMDLLTSDWQTLDDGEPQDAAEVAAQLSPLHCRGVTVHLWPGDLQRPNPSARP